ncbi:MAG: hypothetical protein JWL70_1602, partial [Acidimicrobiia bacterium]|nr:hypothetical protein [Acidimicrobiia bacterium]
NGSASARFRISLVGFLAADGSGGPALVPTTRVANALAVAGGGSANVGTGAVPLPKANITNGLVLLTAHGGPTAATVTINDGEPVVVPANQVITSVVEARWGKTLVVKSDANVTVDLDVFAVVVDKGPGFNPLLVDLQATAPPAAGVPIGLDVIKAGVPPNATAVLVQLTAEGGALDQLDLFTGNPNEHLNGVLRYGPGHPGSATVVARISAEGRVVVHTTLAGTVINVRLLGWYG